MSGVAYDGLRNCVIASGGLSGILNALLATIDVGDEVVVTDPTYVGLLNRIRLAGGVPRAVPFVFRPGETRQFDPAAIRSAIGAKTRAMLLMSPSMPSGGVLDADDWAVVAELCVAHSLLLIVDSAMERLLFGRPQSAAPGRSAGHGGAHNYRWQRLDRVANDRLARRLDDRAGVADAGPRRGCVGQCRRAGRHRTGRSSDRA
jgi:aspartate/methionine/tyrosine aminotransferase